MLSEELQQSLLNFWNDTLTCCICRLPSNYTPQFRPIGKDYKVGGIIFVQINPGQVGNLSNEEINARYKSNRGKKIARQKREATDKALHLQDRFIENPNPEAWRALNSGYWEIMQGWGWPPGKYIQTVKKYGVNFDSIAILNLAQCPVPGDDYNNLILSTCWFQRTKQLFEILKPKIVVAQGGNVFTLLKSFNLPNDCVLLEGVHHRSGISKEKRKLLFDNVSDNIKKFFPNMNIAKSPETYSETSPNNETLSNRKVSVDIYVGGQRRENKVGSVDVTEEQVKAAFTEWNSRLYLPAKQRWIRNKRDSKAVYDDEGRCYPPKKIMRIATREAVRELMNTTPNDVFRRELAKGLGILEGGYQVLKTYKRCQELGFRVGDDLSPDDKSKCG